MAHPQNVQRDSVHSPIRGVGVVRILASWIVAGVSIALLAGFGYWAVSLGKRDPNEVPIIRAMEGPARVLPENPGGQQTRNQGLAVNKVQAEGGVQAPSERVVLAPPPEALAEEDVASASLAPQTRPVVAQQENRAKQAETPVDLVVAAILKDQKRLASVTPDAPPSAASKKAKNIKSTAYSPTRSLRPLGRPADLTIELAKIVATSASTQTVDSVPVGTRLVQLGAYDSATLAKSEWDKLFAKHSDLLEDKKRLIQSAESGGRKFYRLRVVGFGSLDESHNLCSALLARGTPCIPVTAR